MPQKLLGGGDDAVFDPFERQAQRPFGQSGGLLRRRLFDAAIRQFARDDRFVQRVKANELRAAADRRQQRFRLIGEEDDQRLAERFFERFEQRVLRGRVHKLGLFDDEYSPVVEGGRQISPVDQVLADDRRGQLLGFALLLLEANELA